jgi:pantoate kinase
MNAKAFCPGHITGFFQICEGDDLLSTGSRGAGLCITLGATSSVDVEHAERQSIQVTINGSKSAAEVTRTAVRRMVGDEKLRVAVRTILDLPQSQGFGMSAAGALSASLALADVTGGTRRSAFEAAHIAEIECRSGLGDVSAIHRGGITIRKKAGLPPIGEVLRIDGAPEVVLAVVGKKLLTRSVLTDPDRRRAINESGSGRVDELVRNPTLENLMRLSASFAVDSGLASRRIIDAMTAASKLGMASMSMLGSSIFAIGDTAGLSRLLADYGEVWICKVDTRGARIL